MKVTRVHLMNIEGRQKLLVDTTEGYMDAAMPISEAMAKCLTVDIHNQVVAGRGNIQITPWGWQWFHDFGGGPLRVPPKLSEVLGNYLVSEYPAIAVQLSHLSRR